MFLSASVIPISTFRAWQRPFMAPLTRQPRCLHSRALVIAKNHQWIALSGSQWVGVADGEANSPDGGYVYATSFVTSARLQLCQRQLDLHL